MRDGLNTRMQIVDLMPVLDEQLSATGVPVRGAGWRLGARCIVTVSLRVANFTGRVWLEGSLAEEPSDADWFKVPLAGRDILDFPLEGYAPQTATLGFTFRLNSLWLRGCMDRFGTVAPEWDERGRVRRGRLEWMRAAF